MVTALTGDEEQGGMQQRARSTVHSRLSKLTATQDPLLKTAKVTNRHSHADLGVHHGEIEVRKLKFQENAHIPNLSRRIHKVHLDDLV